MSITTSANMKKAVFQQEINGVLFDLLALTHVDNVIYEKPDGTKISLSEKLAEIVAAVALKADSADVTEEIQAANDALYNKIMGITAEDSATVDEAYDTLKEVAAYLNDHGEVVQGFTTDIAALKTAVEGLQTGLTTVEHSNTNGNIKVDGEEVQVYTHPATHPASMIEDTPEKVMMTAAERTKLAGVAAGASAIVSGTGTVAEASAVPTLMIKIIEDDPVIEPDNE